MDFKISIEDDLLYVRFADKTTITADMIIDVLTAERAVPEYRKLNDVWDTRGCTVNMDVNYNSMVGIIEHIKKQRADGIYHRKSALIVDTEVTLGLSRMFQILGNELPYEIEIFDDYQKAMQWIVDGIV